MQLNMCVSGASSNKIICLYCLMLCSLTENHVLLHNIVNNVQQTTQWLLVNKVLHFDPPFQRREVGRYAVHGMHLFACSHAALHSVLPDTNQLANKSYNQDSVQNDKLKLHFLPGINCGSSFSLFRCWGLLGASNLYRLYVPALRFTQLCYMQCNVGMRG